MEVENALVGIKYALMKPFIGSGLAKLKQRRISNPLYVELLIKRNVVGKNSAYQSLFDSNSPPLDQTCIIAKPVHIEAINNVSIPAATAFIESIICFDHNWLFVLLYL